MSPGLQILSFVFRHRVGVWTAIVILCIDQIAKHTVSAVLGVGESWPAYGHLRLSHVTNSGNTLDLFSGHSVALIAVSAVGVALLFALYWPRPKTGVIAQLAFGLMLAGVTGNLVDRVILGHVTDFIDVMRWFVFNVADVAILFGLLGFMGDMPWAAAAFVRARAGVPPPPGPS